MPVRYGDWLALHLPKTGGTTVRAALLRAGGEQWGGGHDLYSQWAGEIKGEGLRVCGSLRDPWTRYVALYQHARRNHLTGMLERWGGGSIAFRDVLYGWTHPTHGRISREAGTIWHPGQPEKLLRAGTGLYTWEVERLYGGQWDALMATDRLDEALPELLGIEMRGIRNANPRPVEYRDEYDDDMVEWVARSEAGLIERHGFAPWEPSPCAVWWAA